MEILMILNAPPYGTERSCVAVFDNAQVRHAFYGGVHELRFGGD
jgi:hypothetical protein